MALIYGEQGRWDSASAEEREAIYARYRAFADEAREVGVMVGGDELASTRDATTVRVRELRGLGPRHDAAAPELPVHRRLPVLRPEPEVRKPERDARQDRRAYAARADARELVVSISPRRERHGSDIEQGRSV